MLLIAFLLLNIMVPQNSQFHQYWPLLVRDLPIFPPSSRTMISAFWANSHATALSVLRFAPQALNWTTFSSGAVDRGAGPGSANTSGRTRTSPAANDARPGATSIQRFVLRMDAQQIETAPTATYRGARWVSRSRTGLNRPPWATAPVSAEPHAMSDSRIRSRRATQAAYHIEQRGELALGAQFMGNVLALRRRHRRRARAKISATSRIAPAMSSVQRPVWRPNTPWTVSPNR